MSKAIGLLLFVCGGMFVVWSLAPTGFTPFFSLAEHGIISEETAEFFEHSDTLGILCTAVILWVVVFSLGGVRFRVYFAALVIFTLGTYLLAWLVVLGVIGSEKTLFWASFSFLAIPLLLMVPFILGSLAEALLNGSGRGGGGGGGSGRGDGNSKTKTIEHYDRFGAHTGKSRVRGNKIEHYDDLGIKTGESKIEGNKTKHYTNWGESAGESKIRGKTITLYDSKGNLIGESHIHGNTIEHRDDRGEDKGSSKIK